CAVFALVWVKAQTDWIARMRSMRPWPWKERSRPRSVAVEVKICFTFSDSPINSLRIERNAATTPLTCGAAMLVPLVSKYPQSRFSTSLATSLELGAAQETIFSPGAREVRLAAAVPGRAFGGEIG